MSSSEAYLDSLLESILTGGKSDHKADTPVQQDVAGEKKTTELTESDGDKKPQGSVNTNKAMSPEEIEEMLKSMGTLGSEEKTEMDDLPLEDAGAEGTADNNLSLDDVALEDSGLEENELSDLGTGNTGLSDLTLDDLGTGDSGLSDFALDDQGTGDTGLSDLTLDDLGTGDTGLSDLTLDDLGTGDTGLSDLTLDDLGTGDSELSDFTLDDLGTGNTELNDLSQDGLGTVNTGLDDLTLDNLMAEDIGMPEGDLDLEENGLSDLNLNDLETEQSGMSGLALDDLGTGDAGLDDLTLDDLGTGDAGLDDLTLDDLGTGDVGLDDLTLDDLGMEETGMSDLTLDDLGAEDAGMSDLTLDDLGMEDAGMNDLTLDDLGTEETGMNDLTLDNLGMEETGMSDLSLDNFGEEEHETDDLSLDDLALEDLGLDEDMQENESLTAESTDNLDNMMGDMEGDLSLDDLALEEEPMSEEDIDRLLSGENIGSDDTVQANDDLGFSDDFALEDTGEDDDLSALLAGMNQDEDLSEINDLLEKSEQGVTADDDMLAMLGEGDNDSFDFFSDDNAAKEAASIREISSEELEERENPKGKKKRKKKEKKPRKKKGIEDENTSESGETDELESLLGNAPEEETEKPKKQGFGAKLMALLFEGDDDENPAGDGEGEFSDDGLQMGNLTEENKEILQELSEEDQKGSKKKGKKDKKKKKGKKGKGDAEEAAVEGEEEEQEEQKEKKSRKKKKKKKEEDSGEDLLAPPEKKLSRKKVISVFLFCGTIAACIILMSSFLPSYMQKHDARIAYDHGYYGDVYDLLYGKELSEEDDALFQKSSLILQMDRKLASYENYSKMGMRLEALDALVSGVARYQELMPKAEQYNVSGEVRERYDQIVEKLSTDFGVSEMDAFDMIASEDDVTYSQKLQAVIDGTTYGAGEEVPEVKQDVLPEEEEIIARLEGAQAEDSLQGDAVQEERFSTEEPVNNADMEQADGSDN